jgi:molecular chaperone DnaK (HSP70)
VFDFGGGTFDAAVVNYINGNLDVKLSAGNAKLGGADLDNKLMGYVLEMLNEKYDLKGFLQLDKYATPRNILLDQIEKAKINLSKVKEVVLIIPPNVTDNKGVAVKEEYIISRELYNQLAGPIFQEAIDICLDLFEENHIKPADLDRVLLVGGPTQYPYFREMIKNQLGIELDTSIDPMTAVAIGAALYAQIKEIPDEIKPEIISILNLTPTDCRIEIHCENKTLDLSLPISGNIILSDGNYDDIDYITITRADKGWASGNIKLDTDGSFFAEVHLRERQLNNFHVNINGKGGKAFTVTSSEFAILQGAGDITDHAPYSVNVTTQGKKCATVIKKNAEYPAKTIHTFYTTKEIKKDHSTEQGLLYFELTEGESETPENNTYLGTLRIENKDLTRNLPIDTELELTVNAKSGRTMHAECYIPYTMQSFPAEIKIARTIVGKEKLLADFEALKSQFETTETNVNKLNDSNWTILFEKQQIKNDIEKIENIIENEINEPKVGELAFADILMKVRYMLIDAKLKLERFENQFIFDLVSFKIKSIKNNLNDLEGIIGNKIWELENQLAYSTEQKLTDEAKAINIALRRFEKEYFGIDFLYYLQGFILTKQNLFARELNSLQDAIKTASRYDLQFGMTEIIRDWNYSMERKKGCLLLKKYYNQLHYELQTIVDKTEVEETFTFNDYDKIGKIWNNYDDYDLDMLPEIAQITNPSKPLLKAAVNFCQAYPKGKIDQLDNLLNKFTALYFIDQSVKGDISISGIDNGPDIRSR